VAKLLDEQRLGHFVLSVSVTDPAFNNYCTTPTKKPAISLKTKHRPRLLSSFVVPRGDHDLLVSQRLSRRNPGCSARGHVGSRYGHQKQ
jgi:hypothetical protein